MCGIAGCYQQTDGQKLVDVMNDRIAHRGPDADGFLEARGRPRDGAAWPPATVDHRSDHGSRPAAVQGRPDDCVQRRALQLPELRAELVVRGVRFVTDSDTEVVLEAWRYGGPEALLRFRGMFAFALFDDRTGELVLARDPLGIKPLYYLRRGDGVVFASELKALVTAVG